MGSKIVHKLKIQKPISFLVAGIASHEKIFVVSNELNRLFCINLDRLQTVDYIKGLTHKKFNAYSFNSEENGFLYSILSNQSSDGVLIDNYKTLDYFFIISGENQPIADDLLINKMKKSKLFLASSYLDTTSPKENKLFQEIVNQLWS
jgi:hypothetical protein